MRVLEAERLIAQVLVPVDIRLHGKGNPNSPGARRVHQIISMIKRIRTSRLCIRNSLSLQGRRREQKRCTMTPENINAQFINRFLAKRKQLEKVLGLKPQSQVYEMALNVSYRGTSLIRNSPPPQDHHKALGIVLL